MKTPGATLLPILLVTCILINKTYTLGKLLFLIVIVVCLQFKNFIF